MPMSDKELEIHFGSTCATLAALHAMPARKRRAMGDTIASFERAAIGLVEANQGQNALSWLRHAAGSGSIALVESFGGREPGSVFVPRSHPCLQGHASWNVDYLRALHAAGLNLSPIHQGLVERALRKSGGEMRDFLFEAVETLHDGFDFLWNTRPATLVSHGAYLGEYLPRAVAAHPDDAENFAGIAARALNGIAFIAMDILGVAPAAGDMIPDFVRRKMGEQLSSHEAMRMHAWRRDPASFFGDAGALDWAKGRFATEPA